MATSSFMISSTCSFGPHHHHHHLLMKAKVQHQQKRSSRLVSACCKKKDGSSSSGSGSGQHFGGRLVDENMVTLRRRIHEMKVAENNYEAPTDWMEWERRYYARYGSDVSELMGMLQVLLLNTRPGLALAAMAVLVLSMPASVIMVLLHFL